MKLFNLELLLQEGRITPITYIEAKKVRIIMIIEEESIEERVINIVKTQVINTQKVRIRQTIGHYWAKHQPTICSF